MHARLRLSCAYRLCASCIKAFVGYLWQQIICGVRHAVELVYCHSPDNIQNGRSVEELATYTGDQEIIEIIRRSRTVVKQEEPFINTLSDYFLKKSSQQRSKAKVCNYICLHTLCDTH